MKISVVSLCLVLGATLLSGEEYQPRYQGTGYITRIKSGPLNVRDVPSLDGTVLAQLAAGAEVIVTGISKNSDLIDGHLGYWLRVNRIEDKDWLVDGLGWVFSGYVIDLADLKPSTISFLSFEERTARTLETLTIQLQRGATAHAETLVPDKVASQEFYTFTWNADEEAFRYSDVPGTYLWYPETGRIEHITYRGFSTESAWVRFTDDFKYVLQDFGTSPPPRAVGIWRMRDNHEAFSGSYYDLNLAGYEIDIIYAYNRWNISENRLDVETLQHAREYQSANPPDTAEGGLTNTLIVRYRYNFETGKRVFLRCEYVLTQ